MTEIVIEQGILLDRVFVRKQYGTIYLNQVPDVISIAPENLPALISALQQLNENTK